MATPWLDAIKKKLGLDKKKPQPVPTPTPTPKPAPGVIDYLKALKLFNASHLDQLGPAVGLSLLTLFLLSAVYWRGLWLCLNSCSLWRAKQ